MMVKKGFISMNIDSYKKSPDKYAKLKYKLRNANVYVSQEGFHFTDHLDHNCFNDCEENLNITSKEVDYIERNLQSNIERFIKQRNVLGEYVDMQNISLLDIGCGGGLFLNLIKESGGRVIGAELNNSRAYYASNKYGLEIIKKPVEDKYWIENYKEGFDVVTLWDVIEHVNYPYKTLKSSKELLKVGGLIAIDTPCRNSFYYRFGMFTYLITKGKYPTLLNAMYSNHQYGHKQIFSMQELKGMFEGIGFEILRSEKFHELSFPYSFYLKKLFKSEVLVKMLVPLVGIFFKVVPIRNKMLIIARRVS